MHTLSLLAALLAAEPAPRRPVPAAEAPHRFTIPEGFRATLFAGEPDLVQPIAFTFDDRGRVWVVECRSYPKWTDQPEGNDRVLIFEDTDGDGRFDKRTVFWDKGANLSGIEYGFGGIWLTAIPNLLFIPDADRDDKPDGPPRILLDGWSTKARHNVVNGLAWGPDGWLWGCNGILSDSKIGKPGTPPEKRVTMNCGVWRYHPTRSTFEVVAHGTTNPWGLDFDDYGQAFITNCVIAHLWHVVPGAHFERMYGQDLTPNTYGLLKSSADHLHWAGGHWTSSRGGQGAHSDAGGGHAHSGCMVYLGDNWPAKYRNGVFTCNIHGSRINHDSLQFNGSTYVAKHEKDLLLANDPWFRGLAVKYGPDGGVYVADWTDTGECHNYVVADTSNGRLFKVVAGKPKPWHGDLTKASNDELLKLLLHPNDWFSRHARRLLTERLPGGQADRLDLHQRLHALLAEQTESPKRLRIVWALHAIGMVDDDFTALMAHADEHVRAWGVRLVTDRGIVTPKTQQRFVERASDSSPRVRLELAAALQRITAHRAYRGPLAVALAGRADDAADPYLPLMIWYGVEPLVGDDPAWGMELIAAAKIPLIREYTSRRLAAIGDEGFRPLLTVLAKSADAGLHRDVLRGLDEALGGRRKVPLPPEWPAAAERLAASPDAEVRERGLALAVKFDDPQAADALKLALVDPKASASLRKLALDTLVFGQHPDVVPLLHKLLGDEAMRGPAIRALAAFADPATPKLLLGLYPKLTDAEKADTVNTLASRSAYAGELLAAVEAGTVPRKDVSAFTARQLLGLKDAALAEKLRQVWGEVRPASREKQALMAKYKAALTPATLKNADRAQGRVVFAKHCASCHRLFDDGGNLGPDLTGAQRSSLDYLLENVLDPSAVVGREYQVVVVELESGRVINGIVKAETERAVTLQTPNETVIVPKQEIASRVQTKNSIMPEQLFEKLTEVELRNLVAYLAGPTQVPLPPGTPTPAATGPK